MVERINTRKYEIVSIEIDKLVIDPYNIRGGEWDYDKELIESIKAQGIMQPLVVRPLNKEKYGIVCGSRRYNAAIEAGLTEVPCLIRELNDREAMIWSMGENRFRKDTPKWKDIEYVGQLFEELIKRGNAVQTIQELSLATGIGEHTIERYLKIYYLPYEVKGLIRPPEDRDPVHNELILLYKGMRDNRTLTLSVAELIATKLRDFPEQKLIEVAVYLIGKSNEIAEKVVNEIVKHPSLSPDEAYRQTLIKSAQRSLTINFDTETYNALKKACLRKQKQAKELVLDILRMWISPR
ncbi:MAG TPA: ParB/RepB/Spo0J family partition protein [Archaeoglobaceae archaeon]|nr:ParB/RepB/Spo0J family partition protein [Archaeoglobaceae archaeon]